jgi:hypothetical protein
VRILVAILSLTSTVRAAEFPGAQWTKTTPAEAGLDEAKLDEARDYARSVREATLMLQIANTDAATPRGHSPK